jgi:hypothetical protein
MNERINDLIDQSGFGSYAEIPDTYIVHKNDLAEFAELIVKESFRVALVEGKGYLDPIKLRNAMYKHFGVE